MGIIKLSGKYSAYGLVWGDVHKKVFFIEILVLQPCVGRDVHNRLVSEILSVRSSRSLLFNSIVEQSIW